MLLGFQHLTAMFGATTLVPLLVGFSVPVALFTAGLGTLIFHLVTKNKVPIFLGSSFAFIPALILVNETTGNIQYAQGGIIVAGLLYVLFGYVVQKIGVEKISKIFAPHIVGTMIFIVGTSLISTAWGMAQTHWPLASMTLAISILIRLFAKGIYKQASILFAILISYLLAVFLNLVNLEPIYNAAWIIIPKFTTPKFDLSSTIIIAPIVIATMMEHIGDITSNGAIVGKNFLKNPGLNKTLFGDGLATIAAGLLGGPPNTTYSENTGVLALTKNYNPAILRIAAIMAIVISFIGKFAAIFATIPVSVLGGISLVLFGMIALIGTQILYKDQVWLEVRKITVVIVMIIAAFGPQINITETISLSNMSFAAIIGIALDSLLKQWSK